MRKTRTIAAVVIMVIAAVLGLFICGVLFGASDGVTASVCGSLLFTIIAGIGCIVYNLDNRS